MSPHTIKIVLALASAAVSAAAPSVARADWIWDRRDPQQANLFQDLRARRVGDVLTILIDENTGFEGQEKREMEKKTNASGSFSGTGSSSSLGQVLRSFGFDFELKNDSKRGFDGKANSTIDRKFTDRMSVVVIGVQPNGNIVIEGWRQRVINREVRTLRIVGVARPQDIGPFNTINSQFIANMQVSYYGRGPDTNYTNQNWGGRIFNVLWPY